MFNQKVLHQDVELESVQVYQDQDRQFVQLNFADDTHCIIDIKPGMTRREVIGAVIRGAELIKTHQNEDFPYGD